MNVLEFSLMGISFVILYVNYKYLLDCIKKTKYDIPKIDELDEIKNQIDREKKKETNFTKIIDDNDEDFVILYKEIELI